jgi:hypothetical protein
MKQLLELSWSDGSYGIDIKKIVPTIIIVGIDLKEVKEL